MSEPSSALSFEQLILRVAIEAGIGYYGATGAEKAIIPIDEHDLDLCKKLVNDGIRMFIADAPPKGWRWMRRIMSVTLATTKIEGTADAGTNATHLIDLTLATTYTTTDQLKDYYAYILTGTGAGSYAKITAYNKTTGDCTVADWLDAQGNPGGTDPTTASTYAITPVETIGGDIKRYPLAENFGGQVDGSITYAADTSHSSLINWCDESFIRARQAATVPTGYPRYAAIRPLEPYAAGFGPKRRFELIVDSEPSTADVLMFPYTLFFDNLKLEAGTASSVDDPGPSLCDSALAGLYPDDYFNGWKIKIISGTGKNSYALVSDYIGLTGRFAVLDWLNILGGAGGVDPVATSIYVVEPVNNLHPAGFRFDETILSACLAKTEQEIDGISAGFIQKYMQKDLPKAYQIDTRSAPRKLGSLNKGQENKQYRNWLNVTYNGE